VEDRVSDETWMVVIVGIAALAAIGIALFLPTH
jgi:hypothetical protein